MSKRFFTVRVGLSPAGDIESVRNAINRETGAIALNVEEEFDD